MKRLIRLYVLASVAMIMMTGIATAEPDEEFPCDEETMAYAEVGGLYETDGVPGLRIESFVRYRSHKNHSHVCEVGIRFPSMERISHCLPNGLCTPGAQIVFDFEMPPGKIHGGPFPFQSAGFLHNKQGHPGGGYQEWRDFWNDCSIDGTCPGIPATSNFHNSEHVDFNLYFDTAADVSELFFLGSQVPEDIAAKCACTFPQSLATTGMHYPAQDCISIQGHHWNEDKFENRISFPATNALRFSTYDCKQHSWEISVPSGVIEWILDNGIDGEVNISFPQPRAISFFL